MNIHFFWGPFPLSFGDETSKKLLQVRNPEKSRFCPASVPASSVPLPLICLHGPKRSPYKKFFSGEWASSISSCPAAASCPNRRRKGHHEGELGTRKVLAALARWRVRFRAFTRDYTSC